MATFLSSSTRVKGVKCAPIVEDHVFITENRTIYQKHMLGIIQEKCSLSVESLAPFLCLGHRMKLFD